MDGLLDSYLGRSFVILFDIFGSRCADSNTNTNTTTNNNDNTDRRRARQHAHVSLVIISH